MLTIKIPEAEFFDEKTQEFVTIKTQEVTLEHSLVSLSKWEAKWNKPFLSKDSRTTEETIDYIRCMTVKPVNLHPLTYYALDKKAIDEIVAYIEAPMTATWFNERSDKRNNEIVTSELIYYWMIALNIPFECQKWHLNRLLTLIRVCNLKSQPPQKMSNKEIYARNKALNEARKKQLNTRG